MSSALRFRRRQHSLLLGISGSVVLQQIGLDFETRRRNTHAVCESQREDILRHTDGVNDDPCAIYDQFRTTTQMIFRHEDCKRDTKCKFDGGVVIGRCISKGRWDSGSAYEERIETDLNRDKSPDHEESNESDELADILGVGTTAKDIAERALVKLDEKVTELDANVTKTKS